MPDDDGNDTVIASMVVPVIVQGAPASPSFRDALLSACSDERKQRVCVDAESPIPATDDGASDAPAATATFVVVSWPDGDFRHVRISLEQRENGASRAISHEARFGNEDPPVERWRAVGLAIATMLAGGASTSSPPETGEPQRARPELGGEEAFAHRNDDGGWAALAAMVGPGLDDGTVRTGGLLSAGHSVGRAPFFVTISGSYAVRSEDAAHLSVRWLTVGAGGGVSWLAAPLNVGLRARAELLVQQIKASLGSPVETTLGGGERVSPGLRAGVEAVWPARSRLAVTTGIQAWSVLGGTGIRLDHRLVGSSSWWGLAGFLGGQCSFP